MRRRAWLGLGGNIGDVENALLGALSGLNERDDLAVILVSPLYKTPPWGKTDQPWFYNCCAEVETTLGPAELLAACHEQERLGKRERIERWGPRTIDIDILFFENIEQNDPGLTIPHPRIAERAFVLVPLAEIAPQLILDGTTISALANEIDAEGMEKLGRIFWTESSPNR